jgi:flavorubredoxin
VPPTATLHEVAPDLYRIATYIPDANLQMCQFLVKDDEPLLFHTGGRAMFPLVREAVARLVDPATIRWIGFSHFEADECGSLNEWLALAPRAQPVCSLVGALTSVNDFASRAARPLQHDEVLSTGRFRFRFRQTPHVPHCWDAGLLFEETHRTLLCSDLFFQPGDVEPLVQTDVLERTAAGLRELQAGPLANVMPYTAQTDTILHGLADLRPRTVATHHGSTYLGDGARALRELGLVLRETYGAPGTPAGDAPADDRGNPREP